MRLLGILLFAFTLNAAEVVRAGIWELHSSFWMNLHQRLTADATAKTPPDLAALTAEEQKAWTEAVSLYRTTIGEAPDPYFVKNMAITQDELSQVADDAVEPELAGPLSAPVKLAAPIYRAHWWAADDATNRFHLSYAAAMLRDAGEELVRQHETVYGSKLPKSIRLDFATNAGQYGGYSMFLRSAGYVTTLSSTDPGYQGLAVLEMALHEASHSVVGPYNGTVARAIAGAAKRLNKPIPLGLWHAILFATSSDLTRSALARRGVARFVTSSDDLFVRVWPQYRDAVEKSWLPYVRGGVGTLDEAISKVVEAVK